MLAAMENNELCGNGFAGAPNSKEKASWKGIDPSKNVTLVSPPARGATAHMAIGLPGRNPQLTVPCASKTNEVIVRPTALDDIVLERTGWCSCRDGKLHELTRTGGRAASACRLYAEIWR